MHRDTLAVQQEQSPPRLSTTSTPDKLQGAVLNATPKFAQRIQERFWPLALLRIISTIGLLLVGSWLLSGCANAPSTLQPQGPAAAQLATLWWVLFWVATAVFVIVMGMLAYALWRPRHQGRHKDNNAPEAAPNAATDSGGIGSGRLFVGIGGALIPALVLVGLMIYTVGVQRAISTPDDATLTIQVIGHQWWWEVYYPDQEFTTANEIHIPVGRPVLIKLTSADVIHSFWAPELQAKMDLLPGQTNTTWIRADRPGAYWVQCAEYCGMQHAHMRMLIVAEPVGDLNTWLAHQQKPAPQPTDPLLVEGQQIYLGSACVYCHTIRGTVSSGQIGPDLTHLADRQTIGAGLMHNNRGSLTGWVVNAQALKPGNKMPPMYLDPSGLHALVAYLESLE